MRHSSKAEREPRDRGVLNEKNRLTAFFEKVRCKMMRYSWSKIIRRF